MRNLAAFIIPSAVLVLVVLLAQQSKAAEGTRASFAAQEINRAIIFALADKNADAVKTIKALPADKLSKEEKSRAAATLGRIYFQQGKYSEAVEQYDQVTKDSPLWLQSVEEKAWAHYHLKSTGKSLALLKTLMNPVFIDAVSPEIYFLQSLNQLKTCDYLAVFKTIDQFKKVAKTPLVTAEQEAAAGDAKAKARVKEFGDTIAKLQLVEVEAIQYVHVTDPVGSRPTISKVSKNSKQLSFPESDEVWLDEIDAYQVQAKGCPSAQGVM
jgi:lipopolysaccharide biosynthesis regulator YciM